MSEPDVLQPGAHRDPLQLDRAVSSDILQVTATPAALALVDQLRAEYGAILFHQSGGCCDGSSPMCYPCREFIVGDNDVHLGEIGGASFFISKPQFEYWKHTQLIIDVVKGRGGMFSLENGRGVRFLVRSRLFRDEEIEALRTSGRFHGH
jgi:uncharacterized protein (DUF779 family)